MFFVPWGWYIKNNEIIGWLQFPMVFLNQWRLPILFVISGMGTAFALSFRSGKEFRMERIKRLLIPLAFGILFIVPPQVYMERIADGDFAGSYIDWYLAGSFVSGIYPAGNFSWHHLWFLPYILVFSLVLSPLFVWLRDRPDASILVAWRTRLEKRPMAIYLFVIPLFVYEAGLEPFFDVTHNLVWDWFNFMSSMTLFFFGFFLVSLGAVFWKTIDKVKKAALVSGILAFALQLVRWSLIEDGLIVHIVEAMVKVVNLWSWIIVLFAFTAKWLNRPGSVLKYANRAVYPFYILHQTVTIVIGFYLMELDWNFWLKGPVMIVGTFGFSWLIYEFLIRRIEFLWPLFGLKG